MKEIIEQIRLSRLSSVELCILNIIKNSKSGYENNIPVILYKKQAIFHCFLSIKEITFSYNLTKIISKLSGDILTNRELKNSLYFYGKS